MKNIKINVELKEKQGNDFYAVLLLRLFSRPDRVNYNVLGYEALPKIRLNIEIINDTFYFLKSQTYANSD
jgi:hypothetical protein